MGGARRAAARRSCPPLSPLRPSRALLRYARKPPASAVGFFCASAGGFRAVAAVRPLARCRPRARSPVARSLAASPRPAALRRGCARPPRPSGSLRASLRPCPLWSRSPRLWLPCGRLRLWSRSRRVFGSPRRGLPAARAGALVWLVRGALPRRGLSRRFAALGGLRSSPPPGYGVYVPASIGPWLATVAPLRWDA